MFAMAKGIVTDNYSSLLPNTLNTQRLPGCFNNGMEFFVTYFRCQEECCSHWPQSKHWGGDQDQRHPRHLHSRRGLRTKRLLTERRSKIVQIRNHQDAMEVAFMSVGSYALILARCRSGTCHLQTLKLCVSMWAIRSAAPGCGHSEYPHMPSHLH